MQPGEIAENPRPVRHEIGDEERAVRAVCGLRWVLSEGVA